MGVLGGYFHLLMGIIGTLMSLVLLLEPAHYFYLAWMNGTIQDVVVNSSSVPYHVNLLNCMLWLLHGLTFVQRNNTLILTINSVGCFMQLGYLMLWVIYLDFWISKFKVVTISIMEIVVFMALLVGIFSIAASDTKEASQVLGPGAVACYLGTYMVLVLQKKLVITGASVDLVNELVVCARVVHCLVWILYALGPFDPYLTMAYSVGLLMWIVEMACIRYYTWFAENPRVVPHYAGIDLVNSEPQASSLATVGMMAQGARAPVFLVAILLCLTLGIVFCISQ